MIVRFLQENYAWSWCKSFSSLAVAYTTKYFYSVVYADIKEMPHLDPLTYENITAPCLTDAGSLYDENSILSWLALKKMDPLTCIELKTCELLKLDLLELSYLNEQELREMSRDFWIGFWERLREEQVEKLKLDLSKQIVVQKTFTNVVFQGSDVYFKDCNFEGCVFLLSKMTLDGCTINKIKDPWALRVYFRWRKISCEIIDETNNILEQKLFFYEKILYAVQKRKMGYFKYLISNKKVELPYWVFCKIMKRPSYFEFAITNEIIPGPSSIEKSLLLKYSLKKEAKLHIIQLYVLTLMFAEEYEESAFLYVSLEQRKKTRSLRKIFNNYHLENLVFQAAIIEIKSRLL